MGLARLESVIKYGKRLLEGMHGLPGLEVVKLNVTPRKANHKKIIIIHKYEAFDATLVIHRVLACICRNYYFHKVFYYRRQN